MKIKQILCGAFLAVFLFSASLFASDAVTCPVDELDMEVRIPAEYSYVFTRDMSEDDPLLADWGVTKEEIFENDSVYLEAFSENRKLEIVLSMIRTDWSEVYYDFNGLSEDDLESLSEFCLVNSSSDVVMEYTEYGLFRQNDQAQFLQAVGTFENEDTKGTAVQYVTVINGNAYTVTFNFYGETMTGEQKSMTEKVVSSVVFHNVNEKSQNHNTVFYVVCILVLVVIIGILLAVIRKQKYSLRNLNGEIAEDPASVETVPKEEDSPVESVSEAAKDRNEEEEAAEETKE
ncbi:MAG: hypothetical protein ACI3W6_09275 [Clostridia bacterium]